MNATTRALRLFVAMPYTDFGPEAKWREPRHVKDFYELVRKGLAEKVQRDVILEIEQDRGESGVVHQAMFKAAYEADLYIADLTGANANVFFELGVRLSLRRSVTVLTSQENKTLFNINSLRVVRYADRPDAYCVKEIVEMLAYGLAHPDHCDSPILDLLKLHVDDRDRWMRLSGQRVRTLLEAAEQCHDPEIALEYVQQAVKDDIFSIEARLALAKTFRQRQDYGSALSAIGKAIDVCPNSWQLYQEQGLILDRMAVVAPERLPEAIASFQKALDLHNGEPDLHCCLGGVYRRRALHPTNADRKRDIDAAFQHYESAIRMQRHNTYAGINLLRLLLIQNQDSCEWNGSVSSFVRRMYHLCAFEAFDSEVDIVNRGDENSRYWKLFDLGDMMIISGESNEALGVYQRAIDLVPRNSRAEVLLSPIRAWRELLEACKLKQEVCNVAHNVLEILEQARQ